MGVETLQLSRAGNRPGAVGASRGAGLQGRLATTVAGIPVPSPSSSTPWWRTGYAPYDELKEILGDTGRRQLLGLQRGLPALATIVGGAPLLGLLGTVLGMINIFKAVATGGSGINETLATGISQALITTATGLIIAIPALFTHSFLEARAVSILADIEAQMMDFLHLVRRPDIEDVEEEEKLMQLVKFGGAAQTRGPDVAAHRCGLSAADLLCGDDPVRHR